MNPRFPIYIISKGRWQRRQTSKTLESMGCPYKIVVEPKEYENYASVIDKEKILVLPDNFSELGQGSIPVRNWVWEHSISDGHKFHWILDVLNTLDNVRYVPDVPGCRLALQPLQQYTVHSALRIDQTQIVPNLH